MIQGFGKKAPPKVNDEPSTQLDQPKPHGIGLAALLAYTQQGHAAPARLLYLVALRWPSYGRYVWDNTPQLKPDHIDSAVVAPFDNLVERPRAAPNGRDPPGDPLDHLDNALWEAWTDFARDQAQGVFRNTSLDPPAAPPPTFAAVCPDFADSLKQPAAYNL